MNVVRSRCLAVWVVSTAIINPLHAQTITVEWLQTVGALCQGTLALDAEVQGDLDVGRLINLFEAEGAGSTSIELTDLKRLLDQFSGDDKRGVLAQYYQCIDGFVVTATSNRSAEAGTIALSEGIVPSALKVIPAENRFVLNSGETVGLGSLDVLLSHRGMSRDAVRTAIAYTESGRNGSEAFSDGESYRLLNGCSLTLYDMDVDLEAASFLFRCAN